MSLKGLEGKRNFLLDINHKTYSDNTKLRVEYIATLLSAKLHLLQYRSINHIFINNVEDHLLLCTKLLLISTASHRISMQYFNSVLTLRR